MIDKNIAKERPIADKRLGQHFLHDRRIIDRIINGLGANPGDRVVEIGPGPGALTKPLIERGFFVDVIEKDRRWRDAFLAQEWRDTVPAGCDTAHLSANGCESVRVVGEDALEVDWTQILHPGEWVVGNLPYNVGTEIVARLVTLAAEGGPLCGGFLFMLQKEVVQRICAKPGGADWGRLAVLCDLLCEREMLFDVGPGAFNPPPKVMSSIVRLRPLPRPRFEVDMKALDRVLRAGFGQRRKMLRASLRGLIDEAGFAAAGVNPTDRPEVLTTAQWCKVALQLLGIGRA